MPRSRPRTAAAGSSIPKERGAHPAQVAAEHSVLPVRLRHDYGELQPALLHLQEGAAHQIGMPADEFQQTSNLRLSMQRLCVQPVQSGNLLPCEVPQRDRGADIERGLVQVRDEQMGLRGVGDGESQARPGTVRVQRPAIVPGAEQAEERLTAEGAGEEAIGLIDRPDEPSGQPAQNLPQDILLKSGIG